MNWLFQISKGEIKTYYTRKTSYVLQANTAQMVLLLQYNAEVSYSLDELVANTGMTEESVKAQMENLMKMKLFKFKVSSIYLAHNPPPLLGEIGQPETCCGWPIY